MTREKFIEELNFNCKVDGKEVWLNIMPCLEKLLDEHEAQLKAKNERIRELEEAMNKTCNSCKHIRIKQFRDYEVATCTNDKCNEMCDCDVGNDFCCNQYEPKG